MRTLFISYRRVEQDDADELRRDLAGRIRVTGHTVTPAAAATWREECLRLIRSADAVGLRLRLEALAYERAG